MKYIIRTLRYWSKSRLGIYIRHFLNIYPASMSLSYGEVSSDLFLWRDVNVYDNYFNLNHLGPVLNPHYTDSYKALLVIYDSDGIRLASQEFILEFGKANLVSINDIVPNNKKKIKGGTFAIFHLANLKIMFDNQKICLAERSIACYKLKSDTSDFMSSVHGNSFAIACNPTTMAIRLIGCYQKKLQQYRCQIDLSDSLYCELVVVNFLTKPLVVCVYEYCSDNKKKIKEFTMSPGGMVTLDSRYDFDINSIIEFESHLNFLRPLIFKHYTNHFDVLHG
jgi:hypothetical protein